MGERPKKYKHYNKLESYEEFVDYVLRRLGAPVIDINIDPQQLQDRISDAIQFYIEYDLESVMECWWIHKVTKEDVENGYLTIPMDVLDVMEVLSSSSTTGSLESNSSAISDAVYGDSGFGADSYMTRYDWNWWNNYWNNGATAFSGTQSLFYYEISMQYIQMMKTLFTAKVEFAYRRRQRKLWFYNTDLTEGKLLCLYGTKMLDPETDDCIWDSDFLKEYATALVGIMWGTNLSKFDVIQGAAGLTINGQAILDRYMQQKTELEQSFLLSHQEPPMPYFGN